MTYLKMIQCYFVQIHILFTRFSVPTVKMMSSNICTRILSFETYFLLRYNAEWSGSSSPKLSVERNASIFRVCIAFRSLHVGFCSAYSPILTMKTVRSSETSENLCRIAWRYFPERYLYENLSYNILNSECNYRVQWIYMHIGFRRSHGFLTVTSFSLLYFKLA
jgi:hypothetical protein